MKKFEKYRFRLISGFIVLSCTKYQWGSFRSDYSSSLLSVSFYLCSIRRIITLLRRISGGRLRKVNLLEKITLFPSY